MSKKYLSSLICILMILISFGSCSINNNSKDETSTPINKVGEFSKDTLDKAKEIITGDNTTDKEIEKYKDNKKVSEFNLEDLIESLKTTGNDVTIIAKEKDFFDAPKFQLMVGDATMNVYDYEELITLRKDISAITENGLIISGSEIEWEYSPHYFTKGEVLVLYDGNLNALINMLESILSKEIF
ncbi:MAG: hypothetical protein ACRC68_16145 [Clostridium sp.]